MSYREHPSKELQDAFKEHPFQGQHPEKASVFFFGIDANYAADFHETNPTFFRYLLEYHKDGVSYWKNNEKGDHHPFLLPIYGGEAGTLYHEAFRRMDLPADVCADHISFVELLNVPTTGKLSDDPEHNFDRLFAQSRVHIKKIHDAIFDTDNKLVFMPNVVIQKLATTRIFNELDFRFVSAAGLPKIYYDSAKNITVHKMLHPSARFHQGQIPLQMQIIRGILLDFIGQLASKDKKVGFI